MKAAMVTTFSTPFPGREKAALTFGRELDEFFAKKAADGYCTEPKTFYAPYGKSFWFVEGEYETLATLFSTPDVEKFLMKGRLLFQDFGYALYLTDNEDIMRRYELALRELHLV
jgi:hypothetical protein